MKNVLEERDIDTHGLNADKTKEITVYPRLSEPRLSEHRNSQKLVHFHEFHYNLQDGDHLVM